MFSWLTKFFRSPRPVTAPRFVRARYDAAQTTDENKRHWAAADSLSAKGANNAAVRKTLRERARYECHENNSLAKGIVLTLSNDLIGTGPRLQVLTADRQVNRLIESTFAAWARAVGLAEKLHTMKQAKTVDGEAFGLLTTNLALAHAVKLDLKVIECDQVTDSVMNLPSVLTPGYVDGIRFDAFGNPQSYSILREHPSDTWFVKPESIPARDVIHWFRKDRPGMARGVPEVTPALPLFGQLRRFTLAVIAAAETAADFSGVLQTDQVPDSGAVELVEDFSTQEIDRRMLVSLPPTYKLNQLKAEQPTTTYQMFKREILTEIARCLNMPYSIAAGDSSDSSYAGGRLEFQSWDLSTRVERSHCELIVLARIFAAWLEEGRKIAGYLPAGIEAELPYRWFWDSRPHVDPSKEASALATLLESNGTTLAAHYALRGEDWEDAIRQRALERELMKELGLESEVRSQKSEVRDQESGANGEGDEYEEETLGGGGRLDLFSRNGHGRNGQGLRTLPQHKLRAEATVPKIDLTVQLPENLVNLQPVIEVAPANVSVNVPTPIVHVAVAAPQVAVAAPSVHVAAPNVIVESPPRGPIEITYSYNPDGSVKKGKIA